MNKTSGNFPSGILVLEEQFHQLRYILSALESERLKLSFIRQFFRELAVLKNPILCQSYIQELLPNLMESVTPDTLEYRSIYFLQALAGDISVFSTAFEREPFAQSLAELRDRVRRQLALTYFYLGEWRQGLSILNISLTPTADADLLSDFDSDNNSQLTRFRHVIEKVQALPAFLRTPGPILAELAQMAQHWENKVGGYRFDRGWVILIERGSSDVFKTMNRRDEIFHQPRIGTIQPLEAHITKAPHGKKDLILFNNRPVPNDDEIHRQAEAALHCIREFLTINQLRKTPLQILFRFKSETSYYKGDSIGLAMGLTCLAGITDIMPSPHQYGINQDLAVTGVLNQTGQINSISDSALLTKLETVLFSPFDKIIIPAENKILAEQFSEKQNIRWPQRRLKIIQVNTLADSVFEPLVVHSKEIGFLGRMFHRSRHLALAITGAFLFMFLFLLAIRDNNPVYVRTEGRLIIVSNSSGTDLWEYDTNYDLTAELYKPTLFPRQLFLVRDFDGDGENEILFATSEVKNALHGTLLYFESDGRLIWRFNKHPLIQFGQEIMTDCYLASSIGSTDFDRDGIPEIVVVFNHSPWFPAHLMVFDIRGNILADYWNSGHIYDFAFIDNDHDGETELFFVGTNNDYDQGIMGVLEFGHIAGHSPQDRLSYVPTDVSRGTERYYLRFPKLQKFLPDVIRSQVDFISDLGNGKLDVRLNNISDALVLYTISETMEETGFGFPDTFFREYKLANGAEIYQDYSAWEIQQYFLAIEYWNGDRWTLEPAENKYWDLTPDKAGIPAQKPR